MIRLLTPVAAALFMTACATAPSDPSGPLASAQLSATKGNTVTGEVRFTKQGDKVLVAGEVRGLKPNGEHGFHVHDKGDCSSGDGMSTGGHFNPDGKTHGAHDHGMHHVGDLPSLKADASGTASFSFESSTLPLSNGAWGILERGLIVHRDADDFQTQPAGNSGPRVACGVIAKIKA
jgi:Cu-Zn family superoxide dismutase